MKRLLIFFISFFILCSLSLPAPEREIPLDEKITGWLTNIEDEYRSNRINLNPVLHITVCEPDAQSYFRTKQPIFLNDGKNKIPLVYQEIFYLTPACTQILAKPKTPLKKDQVYTLEYQTKLGLPDLSWTTNNFDFFDYNRPFFNKETVYNDTILDDFQKNAVFVSASDESHCGGILELFLTPNQPVKILLGNDYTIPLIIVNQLPFDDTNSICNYKLTLIDESGNLSLKSKTGKIQLQKMYKDHMHESQGNCCRIPKDYESQQPKSFIMDLIMLKNPLLSFICLVIMVFFMFLILRNAKRKEANKKSLQDTTIKEIQDEEKNP